MKISFVVPAYNEEKYVGKCLESIIKNTAASPVPVEIIAVNNASADRTEEVIKSFPSVILVNEPQKGLPKAREAGYLKSTGDLIANIDSDALLPENWLKTALAEFDKDPNLVALSGPHIYYDLSGFTKVLIKGYYALAYVLNFITELFRLGAVLQGGNFVVRREALEKIGGFDTTIQFYGEDTDLGRRLSKVGKVKFTFKLPIDISGRRLATEGVMTMATKYAANFFWILLFKKPYDNTTEKLVRPGIATNDKKTK